MRNDWHRSPTIIGEQIAPFCLENENQSGLDILSSVFIYKGWVIYEELGIPTWLPSLPEGQRRSYADALISLFTPFFPRMEWNGRLSWKTTSFLNLKPTSPNKKYKNNKKLEVVLKKHINWVAKFLWRNRVLLDYRLPASVFSFTLG